MRYNGKVFFRCGIQRRRFSYVVGYNRRGFFPLWDTTGTISGWQTNFVPLYPTMQEIFLPLYPTPQQNLVQCTVSQKNLLHCIPQRRRFSSIVSHNGKYFPPLWDTMEEVFFRCGIQQKKLSSNVGYNGRGFFHCGIQRKRFFSIVGYNGEKNIQRRMIFLNFKCLSLPPNKNFGKISYLNSQTNPLKELKMENYLVNHANKIFFSIVGYNAAEIFLIFELK